MHTPRPRRAYGQNCGLTRVNSASWSLLPVLSYPAVTRALSQIPSYEYISGISNRDGFWNSQRVFWDAFWRQTAIVSLTSVCGTGYGRRHCKIREGHTKAQAALNRRPVASRITCCVRVWWLWQNVKALNRALLTLADERLPAPPNPRRPAGSPPSG